MWPRSSLHAVERRRCRSQPVISNPTDNESTPSFADVLMRSDCLRFLHQLQIAVGVGEEKITSTRDAALLREGPMSASPGRGAFLPCSCLSSPASSHCSNMHLSWANWSEVRVSVGTAASLCLPCNEPMTPGCRRWTAGASHYIIKQVFAHCKRVCSFRKLPWTIRKRELVLPQLYLYW